MENTCARYIKMHGYSIKNFFDYIPLISVLGIFSGFGSHTTLIGAFIAAFIFAVFKKNSAFIFGAAPVFIVSLAFCNVYLGGRSNTLFALLFISSIIIITGSFFLNKIKIPIIKPVSSGFGAGSAIIALILSIPLILGKKTFCSLPLFFSTGHSFFSNVNENSIVISCLVLGVYYYLSKWKVKFIPGAFLSVLAGGIINYIYNLNLEGCNIGFSEYTPVISADFGHIVLLLFFGFIISVVMYGQMYYPKNSQKNENKKVFFLIGLSNIFSSMTGSIAGNANISKNASAKIQALILLVIIIFFDKIIGFIPVCAAATILLIKMYEYIKTSLFSQKPKTALSKTIFAICMVTTVFNVILGVIISSIINI
ncbi:MAG: hypothetical protein LUE64_06695, partial [Candidatus Gastranaerophilales bacterium]|nr:hypothetical protein [Candidatus Gastranaerophilales bacterium]